MIPAPLSWMMRSLAASALPRAVYAVPMAPGVAMVANEITLNCNHRRLLARPWLRCATPSEQ